MAPAGIGIDNGGNGLAVIQDLMSLDKYKRRRRLSPHRPKGPNGPNGPTHRPPSSPIGRQPVRRAPVRVRFRQHHPEYRVSDLLEGVSGKGQRARERQRRQDGKDRRDIRRDEVFISLATKTRIGSRN